MGKTKKLLGIEFEEIGNSLFIHQRSYIRRLCEIYEKYKYPVSSLPISKGQVLSKLDSPKTSEEILTVPYRNLIGSLSFIAIRTRPDIMYAVNVLSQFQANPGIKHWNCLLRLLGYLKYTQEYKLELSKVKSLKLRCYSDSDFATNRDDRVSMGGFITFIDETPISWRTFKQKSVSLSTMEAEYVSLTEAAKEFIWLKNVIDNKSLNLELSENVMFCDNQAAISFSKSPVENYRTKHIDVRYHFLRNLIYDKNYFFMNSVASTLNRVTDMEFNNQISVLTQNNWNTWKHDMQVLLMHYGCWQFIIQTKPEQPDEEATYQEKLDLQLRKDRCYTLIYTNISSDLKNLITETTDGVAAWKILKDHFEPVTKARIIQLLDQFFGTKYQPGEDVGIFISRVKTAATRLQEAGHKLNDLYIGFQLIRWLPQEFQSTVQQIYRWKEEDFRVVKIEAELILEANRLQLMKQDLEKAENAYLSSFTSKKSKTLPGATAAAHGDPNGKNDYQKKGGKVFNCKTIKNVKQSIKTIGPCYVCNKYGHLKVNCKEKKSLQKSPSTVNETFNIEFNINLRFCEAECSLLELDKQLVTSCILFEENSDKGVWVIDTAATSHFCNDKSLFLDLKPITNMKMSLATEDKSCPVEGIGTLRFRVKYKGSFHEITLSDVLFNPKLRRNLLSGSRLESKGAHFVGTKGKINVFNKDWIKLFSATRHENLYFFKPDHYIIPKSKEINFFSDVTAKTKNGSIEIWHQRFCHVNNDYLVKTSKNDSVRGLPRLTDNGKTHCIPCKLAKSKRVSFKKTGAVRSKRPLELLHMDLCGPMPTESQGGNKYFLSIIDDYSRKVTVFPIRNKSDVFHTFIRFQKRAERFLSKR
ncbi:retrovirus-related Pol polyprotein from transposon TNT 1-94 [Trichonephila clavipes]|nr:retrovirus-related Pol polyprotein from transposon TNT 1-94 [Trichonephila clavipes]